MLQVTSIEDHFYWLWPQRDGREQPWA